VSEHGLERKRSACFWALEARRSKRDACAPVWGRRSDLRPIDRVSRIHVPKLFIAGANDDYTKIDESRAIVAAAAEPKELWVINGAKHEDLLQFAGQDYQKRILQFFDRYLRKDVASQP